MELGDDAALVARVLEGDQGAFAALVARYQPVVYGITLSLAGDFAAAEDLAQESLLHAYLHLRTLDEPARFGNWLRIIALNRARTYLRQRRPFPVSASEGEFRPPVHILSVEQLATLHDEERRQSLLEATALEALRRLPLLSRQLLVLCWSGGQTTAQAAQLLDLSQAAAKMRLHRARKQLQEEVTEMVERALAKNRPDLEFAPAEVTVLSADLPGVAAWRREMGTVELAQWLGECYEQVAETIADSGGMLDQYTGTSFTALYGEPLPCADHAHRACLAALDLKSRLAEWRERKSLPPLGFRCGLSSGQVLVGNLRSGRRTDRALVGEAVEVAGYLKQLSGCFWVSIVVSGSTYQQIDSLVAVRALDRFSFSGSSGPVEAYQLLARKGGLDEEKRRVVGLYQQGLEFYRQAQWAEAQTCFTHACGEIYNPRDWPSRRYVDRCWLRLAVPEFTELAQLQEAEMAALLREVDQRDLLSALREVDLDVREAFFRPMSQRVRLFMQEELDQLVLRRYSREEIAQTQRKILQLAGRG